MSIVFNGNGNGNGTSSLMQQLKKKADSAPPPPPPEFKESQVVFQTIEGVSLRGLPLRVTRHAVVFELYNPRVTPQLSEALDAFKIVLQERIIYAGRAVIRNVLNAGVKIICEATLNESSWTEVEFASGVDGKEKIREEFNGFVRDWQKFYLVTRDYKVVIADLQTFLSDLRLWLDQVEMGIRSAPVANRVRLETEIAQNLRGPVTAALGNMFERFEMVAGKITDDLQPAHRAFGQRQLHSHLLCAPFIHRTYTKPLGYAGDYEMMNMIVRNGLEGNSLYAKLTNAYLLDQIGPQAVRGRVGFLTNRIIEETGRIARLGRMADIYSIACGPAWEAVNFIAEHPLANHAKFQLLDFDGETLEYTRNKIETVKTKHHRRTQVNFVKNSVQNLLRARSRSGEAKFDLIYCSGLYDYLNDTVCKSLNTYLYDLLRPGGLLVVGNFAPNTPVRNFIEHFLEWFLIYRDGNQLLALAPGQAARENCVIRAEPTTTNIFMEVRKPE